MAYTNNIPQPTDRISDSQAPILANFAALKTVVDINHVTFDDPSGDQGKHKWVTFPEQGATPVTAANEMAIFSRLSTLSAQTELAVVNEGAGDVYEFTSAGKAGVGWTRLPSGILLKWANGLITTAVPGGTTYTWPVAANIPPFAAGGVYGCYITPRVGLLGADRTVTLTGFSTTNVTTFGSNRSDNTQRQVNYNILAIGI